MNNSRSIAVVLFIVLCGALTAVYWNHFDNAFHFDDSHTIVNNHYITDISNIPLFFTDPRAESSLPENQTYRPIITTLNAIDYWLAEGLDPKVFHVHIFLEFLVLLLLLNLLFLRIFELADGGKHYFASLFATAFFAFHTATAETINYIIARSDGFSTLMVVAGLLIFISGEGWKKQFALIPLVVGILAKPTALMLVPLIILFSLIMENPSLTVRGEHISVKRALARVFSHASSFLLIGIATYLFTRSMYPDTWIPGGASALEYLNTQPYVILIYLKTFCLPTGLTADTDLKVISEVLAPSVLAGITVIVATILIAAATSLRRNTLPICFGILWFYVTLAPTSSVIPLAEVLNHHRTFFPYIGLVMAVTWTAALGINRWLTIKRSPALLTMLSVVGVSFLGLHAYGAYQRNEIWHSDLSLWKDVTEKSPENGRGWMNYGLAKMRRGEYEAAIASFQMARFTDYGSHPYLHLNLGIATDAQARKLTDQTLKSEAEDWFKIALRRGARYPATHYFYADWLHRNGRTDEALPLLNKALDLSPAYKSARDLLLKIKLETESDLDKARQLADQVNTPEAYLELSLQLYNGGQWEGCISAARKALELRPGYAAAFNNICAAQNQLGQFSEAKRSCEQALKIRPDFPLARGNLNRALSELKTD